MEDGIRSKISMMDDECQMKLQDTMQKIVNDSNGGWSVLLSKVCKTIRRIRKSYHKALFSKIH